MWHYLKLIVSNGGGFDDMSDWWQTRIMVVDNYGDGSGGGYDNGGT